jgi:ribosomal-protein-alanine N-acetyltransferase
VTVRPAGEDDAPACLRLQRHLPRRSPALLAYGLGAGDVLVTTADGDVAGYLLPVAGPETHVAEVVVAPAARREGRGQALFAALFDRVTGRVTVATRPDNAAALSLYDSLGFERERVDPTFYAPDGDENESADEGDPAVLLARRGD